MLGKSLRRTAATTSGWNRMGELRILRKRTFKQQLSLKKLPILDRSSPQVVVAVRQIVNCSKLAQDRATVMSPFSVRL